MIISVSKAFGDNLRELRKRRGFSQEELARVTGIDRSYVGKIERGQVNITLEKIVVLADCLQCCPSELIPGNAVIGRHAAGKTGPGVSVDRSACSSNIMRSPLSGIQSG